ncbi:MAG: nucleotidyltransferase domain-containing protein, partial [Thermoplasmata archaeon]|nr:nucleotidyltransferase domain-containing protein [Thermoplasmata archaeon]
HDIVLQMKIRTWRPDLVALKGEDVVIVEVKGSLGDIDKAVAQAAAYTIDATFTYIAIPEARLTKDLERRADALGIGILTVNDHVRTAVQPQRKSPRPSFLKRAQAALGKRPRIPEREQPRGGIPYDRFLKHKEVIDVLFSVPGRRFTIRELSIEADSSYATTWRLVNALISMGALRSEVVGPSRLLSINEESPITADLKGLKEMDLLPHRKVAERFAELLSRISNVQKVILFGSVAEGRANADSDIDIAVVIKRRSEKAMRQVYDTAADIQDETGMKVVPIRVLVRELESDDQLILSLKRGVVLFERG